MGRQFRWLWAAYAVSAYGSGLGFGALPLIAVLVLHASPAQVSALSAVGPAVGALIALPLGPWVEFRRKRPVMIAMDLVRFAAIISLPFAYASGMLTFAQLLAVSATTAAAKIAFNAASGSFLKSLVPAGKLLTANARFESTQWSSIAVGPPLGGAAIGLFGPVTTVVADALSYLLSALGILAIGGREDRPLRPSRLPGAHSSDSPGSRSSGGSPLSSRSRSSGGHPVSSRSPETHPLLDGWRHILGHPGLRALFANQLAVGGLIMATEPLLAVLMLRDLDFPPWQYGLAFAAPCLGGLIGSRLARRVVARHGRRRVIRVVGTLRAIWLIGLVLVRPGVAGLLTVIAVELAIIISMSLYSPVLATYRLQQTPQDRVARTLTAWSIASSASIAVCTALAGLLADATSPRTAIGVAGLLILASPLLLPGRRALRDDQDVDSCPATVAA
ncbi:MFS transporter [Paractinoplanes rhizophilus]|uniref:MFS transporter n=1 Tax=Paractinoplanes rhizophilus TaxID=1416877 RepID=A0ABW2HLD8_9ACTN